MSYTGTVVGTPTFGAAKFNNGLTAVSGSNYISVPTGVDGWGATADWTWEAWLKTATSGTEVAYSIGNNGDDATNKVHWFGVSSGKFACSIGGTGAFAAGAILDSGITINDGAWHHCRVTMSGSGTTCKLAVDGSLGATFSGAYGVPDHTNGQIGAYVNLGFAWSGAIDEIALFDAALATSYTPPSAEYAGNESNLRALFHLQSNGTDSAGAGGVTYAQLERGIRGLERGVAV